jgi:hypothetical protein
VAYCRKADWKAAHKELYSTEAKSIEPYATPDFEKITEGMEGIQEKARRFNSMVEKVHSIEVSEPLVAGNSIAFTLAMDMTVKGKGRMNSPELCVYQVRDGKIVVEEFFV